MLDKIIPYHSIIMKRPYGKVLKQISLPDGFTVRNYQPGDENAWAEIETLVLEFDDASKALKCHSYYLSQPEELRKRQWFVIAPNGVPAATATAWWTQTAKSRVPVVHALGCRPEYQGNGLGKAVAIKMLETFYELEEGRDVWLDTQTWSYQAIGLYLDLGFIPLKEATYNSVSNEYSQALPVLETRMTLEQYQRFIQLAI